MKISLLTFFLFLFVGSLFAQPVVIYEEDFSGYAVGALFGSGWSTSISDCDDAVPEAGVRGGRFEWRDLEGTCGCGTGPSAGGNTDNIWETSDIPINGCNVTASITVGGSGPLECDSPGGPDFSCNNSHDQMIFEYSLDGGAFVQFGYVCGSTGFGPKIATGLSGGTLRIRVTGGTKANDELYWIDNVRVIGNPATPVMVTGPPNICAGQTATLTATAGFDTYQWSDGQSGESIDVATPGTYRVTATSAGGCQSIGARVVTAAPPANPTITAVPSATACSDGSSNVVLSASAGFTSYSWSNGRNTRTNTVNAADIYSVTVTNAAGCTGETDFSVAEVQRPTVIDIPNQTACQEFILPDINGSDLINPAYYTGNNGTGLRFEPGTVINTTRPLFIYDGVTGCNDQEQFTITITQPPNFTNVMDQAACDNFTLPPLVGTGITPNRAYFTEPDGGGTRFAGGGGEVITTSQTLYARDGTGACVTEVPFDVTITASPMIDDIPDPSACAFYVLPEITGTDLDGSEAYYTQTGGMGTPLMAGDTIRNSTTLFIYAGTPDCNDEQSFNITITSGPVIDPVADQIACLSYTLPNITGTNLSGNEAYFTETNGGGNMLMPGDAITTSQTIFIFDQDGTCTSETSFTVTIVNNPNLSPIANQSNCGFVVLPTINGTNLTGNEAYYTEAGGMGMRFEQGDTVFTSMAMFFMYDGAPGCEDEESFMVEVLATPVLDSVPDQVACDFFTLPDITGTNLSGNEAYFTEPNGGGSSLAPGDAVTVTDTVFIFDTNGNCSDEQFFTVTINAVPFIDDINDQLGCNFLVLPVIPGLDLSGNEAYFTETNGGGTRFMPGDTIRTSQTLFAFDDNGACTAEISFDVLISNPPTVMVTTQNLTCNQANDGSVGLSVQGNAPFTFNWDVDTLDGQQNISALPAGTYNVTVTDNRACSAMAQAIVTEPAALTLTCGQLMAVSGVGLSDGQAEITFDGGVAPYNVSWTGAASGNRIEMASGTFNLDNLSAGAYEIQITDANDCTISCNFAITVEGCDIIITANVTDASCANARDGALDVTVTGATMPFTFDWNDNTLDGTEDPIGLRPGTYILNFTDANSCTISETFEVGATFASPTATLAPGGVICEDDCFDFAITFTGAPPFILDYQVDAGTGPVIRTLTTNRTNESLQFCPSDFGITSGSITVELLTILDQNCQMALTQTETTTVNAISRDTIAQILCTSESLMVNGTEYAASNPSGIETVVNGAANGCDSVIVVDLTFLPLPTFDLTQTLCANESIMVNGTVYDQSNPSGNEVFNGAGANGCDSIVNIDLSFFPTAVFDLNQTLCEGESVDVNGTVYDQNNPIGTEIITGGSVNGCDSTVNVNLSFFAPIVFDLNQTLCIGETITVNGNLYDVNNPAGTEILVGAAANGCDSTVNVNLTFLSIPVFDLNQTLCAGESINVNGNIYDQNNPIGTETLIGASANGCDSVVNVNLTFLPIPVFDLNQTLCTGESLDVNGIIYDENNPTGTETLLGAATNGCDSIVNIALIYVAPSITDINNTLCPGETLTVNGVTYDENNSRGTEIIPGGSANGCDSIINVDLNFFAPVIFDLNDTLCAGESVTVNGTVYDQNNPTGMEVLSGVTITGCDSTVNVNLSFFPPAVFDLNQTLCIGETITVNGNLYDVNNPTGTETLVAAAASGCDSTVNISLSFFAPATFDLNQTLCAGESITVNGNLYDENNPTGTETLIGASANGCDSTVNISLTYVFPITNNIDMMLCAGESMVVNGVTYNAANPSGTETILGASANGCDSIINVNLSFLPEVVGSIVSDASICAGEVATLTFQLTGASLFDIRYSDGNNPAVSLTNIVDGHTVEVMPNGTTTYAIELISVDGSICPAQIGSAATVAVSNLEVAAAVASNFGGFGVSCANGNDGVLTVNTNNGIAPFEYLWDDGSTNQQRLGVGAGSYNVIVRDAAGCEASSGVTLEEPQAITVITSTRDPLCSGDRSGAIVIDNITGGTAPYEVSTDRASYRAINGFPYTLGNLATGNYTLFVRDINDCEVQVTASIIAISEPQVDLGPDLIVSLGDSIELEGLANFTPSKIEWSPIDYLSSPDMLRTVVTPEESTVYTLTVSDTSGCVATDRITVLVNRQRNVFVPTAFSPNGDGSNDVFYINGGNDIARIKTFIVFDRWGNQMFQRDEFQPNDPLFGWDGTFNGREVSLGVYVYYAEIEFIDGFIEVFEGDVAVVR